MSEQTNKLMPDAKTTRVEQYSLAWEELLSPTTAAPKRAHAKCWLTYRCIEGEVPVSDWVQQIEPVNTGCDTLRWTSSQLTAEAYLYLLNGDFAAFTAKAGAMRNLWKNGALQQHPGACLNYLRIMALLAYGDFLHENGEAALEIINEATTEWRGMWATFNPFTCPFRFAEMQGDSIVLHCMMRILQRMDRISAVFRQAEWADSIINKSLGTHWWNCMLRLSLSPKAIWFKDAGIMVDSYKVIHAQNPKYGSGPGKEESERIRAVIADKCIVPTSVIDYGCGNSTLAERIFPSAAICRYDPAIAETAAMPSGPFDLGICTDVMEHIPASEITAMWEGMRELSQCWYFTIHTGPAGQRMPDGTNAHCTQQPPEWWQQRLGGKIVWQKGVRFGLLVDSRH